MGNQAVELLDDTDEKLSIGEIAASDAWREDGEVILTGHAEMVYNGAR